MINPPPGLDPVLDGPMHRQARLLRERLELVFPPRLFAHDYVPARLTPAVWSQIVRRKPFVGIGFVAAEMTADQGRIAQSAMRWEVFLLVSNPRAPERLLGDRQGAGLFGMIQVAVWALHGWTLGGTAPRDAAGTAQVTRIDHSYFAQDADDQNALGQVAVTIPLYWRADLPLDEFLRTRVVWDFPAEGAVTDDITVRTNG